MTLPNDFVFSQASLQDFVDCRRRFQYRYLMGVRWPALPAEPPQSMDHLLRLGNDFHRLVQQHQLGIPEDRLTTMVQDDPELRTWWSHYLADGLSDLPAQRYPEVRLRGSFSGRSVVATFDLLAVDPGRQAIIVDWKTSHHRPSPEHMDRRLQTKVYPAVLVQSGAGFNDGQEIEPEMIHMRYWFPEHPHQPIEFAYDRTRFEQDVDMLDRLVSEALETSEDAFVKTEQVERCRYCIYRSLCDRGQSAGKVEAFDTDGLEIDESWEESFDFDQIAEVAW
ncbi:MAG: PD-(D/E)XK nuclease family protein [Anaerolineales bacterium]|jgi:CRISPR/Cas system-associated exonuclease Cas4 (RecB family)